MSTRSSAHAAARARRAACALVAGALAAFAVPAGAVDEALFRQAHEARLLEDIGDYGRAADSLRALRTRVPGDADLEIALALDEARSGQLDSARTRLWQPLVDAALADTLPASRRVPYGVDRESTWVDGRYGGWSWYPARARAEVAAALGRWDEALAAARLAVAARPLTGREWIVLATSAIQAGWIAEASQAAERALTLDPGLPEAQHWAGLLAWRAGRRADAIARFDLALSLDSTYREPALARMRARMPGRTSVWPKTLLNGEREVGLLTSPARPKFEEMSDADTPPQAVWQMQVALPDSVHAWLPAPMLTLPVLVDARGRLVLAELPWLDPAKNRDDVIGAIMTAVTGWRFKPAMRRGVPVRAWAAIRLGLNP